MSDISSTEAASIVRRARTLARLSQRELATRAGTAQPSVARIEAGRTSPTMDTLVRLVEAAGFQLRIDLSERTQDDAIIEAYKRDIDRTLLRENLKKSAEQRVQSLTALSRFAREARRAGQAAKRAARGRR